MVCFYLSFVNNNLICVIFQASFPFVEDDINACFKYVIDIFQSVFPFSKVSRTRAFQPPLKTSKQFVQRLVCRAWKSEEELHRLWSQTPALAQRGRGCWQDSPCAVGTGERHAPWLILPISIQGNLY